MSVEFHCLRIGIALEILLILIVSVLIYTPYILFVRIFDVFMTLVCPMRIQKKTHTLEMRSMYLVHSVEFCYF